jgi:hypothetical protein
VKIWNSENLNLDGGKPKKRIRFPVFQVFGFPSRIGTVKS